MGQLTAYFGGGRRSKKHVVLCGSTRVFLLWSSLHQRHVTWDDGLSLCVHKNARTNPAQYILCNGRYWVHLYPILVFGFPPNLAKRGTIVPPLHQGPVRYSHEVMSCFPTDPVKCKEAIGISELLSKELYRDNIYI